MARAAFKPVVRGTLHSSFGDSERRRHDHLSVAPTPESFFERETVRRMAERDEDSTSASFERMMRNNRAAGL